MPAGTGRVKAGQMPERAALAQSLSHSRSKKACFLDPCCQGGSWQGYPQGSEGQAGLGQSQHLRAARDQSPTTGDNLRQESRVTGPGPRGADGGRGLLQGAAEQRLDRSGAPCRPGVPGQSWGTGTAASEACPQRLAPRREAGWAWDSPSHPSPMGTLDKLPLQAVFQTRLKPWANFRQSCTPNLMAPGPSSPRDCTLQMAPALKPKDSRWGVPTPASPPAHVWPRRGQSYGEVWPAGPGLGILGWLMPLEVDNCLIPGPVAGRSHLMPSGAQWPLPVPRCPRLPQTRAGMLSLCVSPSWRALALSRRRRWGVWAHPVRRLWQAGCGQE